MAVGIPIVPQWWQICSYIHMKLMLVNICAKNKFKKQKASFNLTLRFIDDVLSLNKRYVQ